MIYKSFKIFFGMNSSLLAQSVERSTFKLSKSHKGIEMSGVRAPYEEFCICFFATCIANESFRHD